MSATNRFKVRDGFTLIEVLIAVLVLALGMLGLAAVFPVAIAQQRDAVDRTQGAVAAEIARDTLLSPGALVSFQGMRRDFYFSAAAPLDCSRLGGLDLCDAQMSFLWEPTWRWGPNSHMLPQVAGRSYLQGTVWVGTGRVRPVSTQEPAAPSGQNLDCMPCAQPNSSASDPRDRFEVPVSARLYPPPFSSGGAQPQYVWDMVPRRTRLAGGGTGLEIAVFVRRIDAAIRVPAGRTLSDVLTGVQVSAADVRVPLGIDRASGLPTGNGTGDYSAPQKVAVRVRSTTPSRIELAAGVSQQIENLWLTTVARPGQTLVDNLGNVVKVVRIPDLQAGDRPAVIVDRVYSSEVTDYVPGVDPRGSKVEEVLFTPQRPVQVFTIRPEW